MANSRQVQIRLRPDLDARTKRVRAAMTKDGISPTQSAVITRAIDHGLDRIEADLGIPVAPAPKATTEAA